MAVYFCEGCDRYMDDDYHPMSEAELCPGCQAEAEGADRGDWEYERMKDRRLDERDQ